MTDNNLRVGPIQFAVGLKIDPPVIPRTWPKPTTKMAALLFHKKAIQRPSEQEVRSSRAGMGVGGGRGPGVGGALK